MTLNVSKDQLNAFVERIERLEEDKAGVSEDIRELYGEAKAMGFDTKVLRQVVKIRKMDQDDRREQEEILDLYMHALGMIPGSARSDTVA